MLLVLPQNQSEPVNLTDLQVYSLDYHLTCQTRTLAIICFNLELFFFSTLSKGLNVSVLNHADNDFFHSSIDLGVSSFM